MTDLPRPDAGPPPEQPPTSRSASRRAQSAAESGAGFQTHMRAARTEFESQVAHARAEFEEANARLQQRTGRNLIMAILIGVAIGAAVVASLAFWKPAFLLVALAASILGTFELTRALQASGRRVDLVPQLLVGTLLVIGAFFAAPWQHWVSTIVAVSIVIVWRLLAQMAARDGRTYGAVLSDVLLAAFVQLYVPFLASLAAVLLSRPGGEWWVLAFLIITVACDTGAYASGLAFGRGGRHPMAPRISPKKTWEGFAGAAVTALGAGVLLAIFMLGMPWWTGLILGAVILGTATAGDLGESMIKRDLGIKDMSTWLPGHGGVLDRLDSILPSATAALALYFLLSPLAVS
jgi:phosphatidate cytidylyltransferase